MNEPEIKVTSVEEFTKKIQQLREERLKMLKPLLEDLITKLGACTSLLEKTVMYHDYFRETMDDELISEAMELLWELENKLDVDKEKLDKETLGESDTNDQQ